MPATGFEMKMQKEDGTDNGCNNVLTPKKIAESGCNLINYVGNERWWS